MLTRRGFIGTMLVLPALPVIVGVVGEARPFLPKDPAPTGHDIEILFDPHQTRTLDAQRLTACVFAVIAKRLRSRETRTVGPADAWLGDTWSPAHAPFAEGHYVLLRDMPRHQGKYIYDRLTIESIGHQLAERVEQADLRYFGNLAKPHGVLDACRVKNARFSLRFVSIYDIQMDWVVGRFDVLGGKG